MKLVLELSLDSTSPYRILLKNGESLKMSDGADMKLINPEAVAKLVPQGNDILVIGKDGDSCLLVDFAKANWDVDPQLNLEDGPLLTWQSFWKNLDGDEDASSAKLEKWDDETGTWVPLDVVRDNDIEATLYKAEATTFREVMNFMSMHSMGMGAMVINDKSYLIEDLRQQFDLRGVDPNAFFTHSKKGQEHEDALEEFAEERVLAESVAQDILSEDQENPEEENEQEDNESPDSERGTEFVNQDSQPETEGNRTGDPEGPDDQVQDKTPSTEEEEQEDEEQKDDTTPGDTEEPTEADEVYTDYKITLSGTSITENDEGAFVGKLGIDNINRDGDFEFEIVSDPAGIFEIVGDNLKLKDGIAVDYEADLESFGLVIRSTDEHGNTQTSAVDIWPQDANDIPTIDDLEVSTDEDSAILLSTPILESVFADQDGNSIQSIRIDSLPEIGVLKLGDIEVSESQVITRDQIDQLSFQPNENWNGQTDLLWSAFDGQAWSENSSTMTIQVEAINDAPVATVSIGPLTTNVDAPFTLDLPQDAFTEIDEGDSLTYTATIDNGDPLPEWLNIDPVSGQITGVPSYSGLGDHSITVVATDDSGKSTQSSFSFTIENINDAPTLSPIDNQSTDEDAPFNLDLSQHFEDADIQYGDTLSYTATLQNGDDLPNWISIDSETGLLSGIPENGDVGNISIKVTASDGEESISDTFTLTAENTNDGPIVTADIANQTTDEDAVFNLDVSANFLDEDLGDTLTYSATLQNGDDLPDWITIDSETGQLSGIPENDNVGDLSIKVTASDGEESASNTFSVSVENTNDGPTVTADIADQTTDEDAVFNLDVSSNFSDEDLGDTLTYTATLQNGEDLPDWVSIDSETGQLSGTPENGDVGNISIKVTASDGEASASNSFSVAVENTNDGPTVTTGIANQTTAEDSDFNLDVSSNFADEDLSDTLTYSASLQNGDDLPDWISIDSETGQLSGTPENGDVGDLSITVTASDGQESASNTFSVSVENTNDGPTVTADIADQTTAEDAAFNLDLSSNFADEDLGDTLTYSASLQNGDDLPDWISIDSETGQLSGTPENSDVGSLSITVTASDGEESATNTFAISVENTNDGPTVTAEITDQTTAEDSAFNLDLSANFADEDLGDTLTYSATLQNGDDLPDWISIDSEIGELSGTPENGDVGDLSITVTASDGQESASNTFSVSVENTNDGPTVTADIADQTTAEDAAFNLDVSSNFADEDLGDTLTYSATLQNGDDLPEWISIDSETGELSGTPENGDVADLSITVTASDGEESASNTFAVSVENTNDGPTVTADIANQTTAEDAAFNLDVSSNFADEDLGDTLTYSATLQNGDDLPEWISIDSETGELSGTPENGDVGDLSITVTASDGEESASNTFSVSVENTNDGPTVTADIADQTTAEDAAFNLDVSSNFADEDLGDTLTYSATLQNGDDLPDWISIDSETGDLSGTPENGDVADLSITVTASDGEESASNTFSVSVENTNDGPTVTADIADQTTAEDAAFNLDLSSNFADEDLGDTLTYSATLQNGEDLPDWITIDSETGELSGTPENGDVGDLSITVTASDGEESASNTFSVSVENTNDGPTVTADIANQTTAEDAAFNLDVSSNFADEDLGDTLTYTATLQNGDDLPDWISIDSETGELSGTPENGDVGDLSITVTASDGEDSASNTFAVSVENTNDGPTVTADIADQATSEDAAFNLDVSSNFADEDLGDTLTYTATLQNGDDLPDWISIDSETGELSGTPENGDVGDLSITVTASDGEESATNTFSVSVENTNDGPTVTAEIADQTTSEDAAFNLDVSSNFAEEDLGDTLTYSATLQNGEDLPDWISIDSETGELSGTPENGDVGDLSITVTASDGEDSASNTFSVSVENTNDGPTVTTGIANQTTAEDSAFNLDVSSNFADEDLGDTLTYSATLQNGDDLPDWISIDSETGELSGTPENGDVGDLSITVTASDGEESATSTFNVTVDNTNDETTVITDIDDAVIDEDCSFELDVSGNFSDDDLGDSLSYTAALENGDPLPSWISLDPETGLLSGTPDNEDVGELSITVTASDGEESASNTFSLRVENTNDRPTVTTDIENQTSDEGVEFNLDVSSNFADEDLGDTLTYSATLQNGNDLPDWISIDSETGELSGTPENGDVGDLSITVTASDGQESASNTFSVSVENTNDGPTVTTDIEDQTTAEDSAFNLDVSSNFADEDLGDTLTYSATLQNGEDLPDWISIDSETGELSGTPENGDVGDLSITVTASDGEESASNTFSVSVENTNDGPTVTTDIADQTTAEDSAFNLDVSSNFADEDLGDTLTYSATLQNGDDLPDWISINSETGELSGTPENGDVGDLSITVTASDGQESASNTFSVSVENTNDGPTVTTDIADQTTAEDAAFNLDVSSNFADEDLGDTLTYSATLQDGSDLPDWITIDSETGELSGTPENGDVADLSITVTASDGEDSASNTFSVLVENTNDGPTVTADIADQATSEDAAFNLDVSSNFADEDIGDTLTYSATLQNGEDLPDWISIDSETGELSGTPENGDVDDLSITVTASDGQESASNTFSVSVENTNDGPTVTAEIADQTTAEDAAFNLDVSSNFADEDLGDTLTYSATLQNGDNLPDWITIDSETGELSGTPENGNVGDLSITVTASDGEDSASNTFAVSVENTNDGPTVTADIADQTTAEDATFNLDVSTNFADEDLGDTLTYTATLQNGDDLPDWISIDSETGELSGTPENGDVADLSITVTASDGEDSASNTFAVSVENTNDGPTVTADIADQATSEDAAFNLDVSSNFADEDLGDTLTYSATLQNGDDLPDWISIDSETGELSGTPENGDVADLSITVTASDGEESASNTFSVSVENTNDGPTVTADIADQTTAEDATFNLDVSANFTDEDLGDTLTYTATLQNGENLPDWISIDSETGELSGTPENGDVGDLSITVTASDGEESASNTFAVSVENTNDGPIVTADIDDQTTAEDAAFNLDISSNFADEDLGDTLTYSATLQNGDDLPEWISIDSETGELSGTPENGDVGDLSITVTASDGEDSATNTFSVSVENTNDGPTVTADIADQTTAEDAAFNLDVSSNFTDEDLGDTLTYSATLQNGDDLPDWIFIDSETGELSGTPENGDVADLSITVTASDGEASASNTFSVSVENTNDGPIVTADIDDQTTAEDAAFNLDISSNFADEDLGDTLTYSATLQNGDDLPDWISIDSETGELSGTPENGDVGDLSITVTASDGEESATNTFAISVENTNDGPTVTADIADQTTAEDAAFNLDVSSNFADEDLGDTLTYSATLENGDDLPNWVTIDSETGELSGTPENGDVADLSITVTASDGEESASNTFSVSVENTNDGPTVTADIADQTTAEDAAFNLDVSSNFADEDLGDTLTYSATLQNGDDLPDWITIDSETGELSGTPENGDVADLSITVTASDGEESASNTFSVSVENTNDGPTAISLSNTSVDENSSGGKVVATLSTEDVDVNDSHTYQIVDENGEPIDSDIFEIVENNIQVKDGADLNHESADNHSISVQVTDSTGASHVQDFTIDVNDLNESPSNINFEELDSGATLDANVTGGSIETSNGGGQGTATINFDGSESGSEEIVIEFARIDNSLQLEINGQPITDKIIQLQSNVYDSDSESFLQFESGNSISSPWIENEDGIPRIRIIISEDNIEILATPTADSTEYQNMQLDSGDFTIPLLNDGENTLTIINPNGHGPDGLQATVTATYTEPTISTITVDENGDATASVLENVDGALIANLSADDQDVGDSSTFSIEEDSSGLFEIVDGTLKLKDGTSLDAENDGPFDVSIQVVDSGGNITTETITINASNVNEGPTLESEISDQSVNEDAAFNLDVSSNFADEDLGDTLTYSANLEDGSDLPGWISIDSETGELSGTPENGDVADLSITVTASDGEESVSNTFSVSVENTNDGPTVTTSIDDVSTNEDSAFNLDVSSNFADEDLGDTLTYSASLEDGSDLPDWISIDSETGELSGTPENGDVGDISITVTASDGEESASNTFSVSVENTNEGPVANADIASVTEPNTVEIDVLANDTDADVDDALSLSNVSVPDGQGSVSIVDGKIVYDPGEDFSELAMDDTTSVEITYTIDDGDGGTSTSTATVTVTGDDSLIVDSNSSHTVEGTDNANTILGNGGHDTINAGGGDDVIIGGDGNDNLYGGEGNDTFQVSEGDDYDDFYGGEGTDTVESTDGADIQIDSNFNADNSIENISSDGNDGVSIKGDSSSQTLDFTETNLDGIEAIDGGGGHDTITGSAGDDVIIGGDGNDNLYGGEGNDTFQVSEGDDYDDFYGGEGTDTVESTDGADIQIDANFNADNSIENISSGGNDGVTIKGDSSSQTLDFSETNLDGIAAIDGGGGHDTITGSAGNDVIIGGDGNDNLYGGEGNDTFQVSEGDDYDDFYGGEGTDTVESTDGADIQIDANFNADNSIENISSGGNDGVTIKGDSSSQTLDFTETNLDGIEAIDGGGGHDTITGSAGDDTVDGGTGTDTYVLEGNRTDYLVTENDDGSIRVEDLVEGRGGVDTVSNFENFRFSDGTQNSVDVLENAPILDSEIEDQSVDEDASFNLDVSSNFRDVDTGDILTYSATLENGDPLPDWMSINSESGELSGTPENTDVGDLSITVTASDGENETSDTFSLNIENTNDGPTVTTDFVDQSVDEGSAFSLDVSNHFQDEDDGDTLSFTATLENGDDLPSWLSFDIETGEFTGNPADGDDDSFRVLVTASDGDESISDTFNINVNDAITSSDPDENVEGSKHDDTISTGTGNDTIDGGKGDDTINSNEGNDYIEGDKGDDTIDAGSGNDTIIGGKGDDTIDAGSGNDTIDATEGYDTVDAGDGDDTMTIDYGTGTYSSSSGSGSHGGHGSGSGSGSGGHGSGSGSGSGGFGSFDGGDGDDTLLIDGSGIELDLSAIGSGDISNIETINIEGDGANSLHLSTDDVLDMTDENNTLFIDGDSDDAVEISDTFSSQGTENIEGTDYTHYYDAGSDAHLYINSDINNLDTF